MLKPIFFHIYLYSYRYAQSSRSFLGKNLKFAQTSRPFLDEQPFSWRKRVVNFQAKMLNVRKRVVPI